MTQYPSPCVQAFAEAYEAHRSPFWLNHVDSQPMESMTAADAPNLTQFDSHSHTAKYSMVQVARSRSPLVELTTAVLALSICVTMLLPRASAFLMQPRMAAVSAAGGARKALRMGLDRSSRPTPRGPKFRRFSSSGSGGSSSDDFAAINPQTLNWEKVGPEEDVFISALSQNGHVNVKVCRWCAWKLPPQPPLSRTTDCLSIFIGRLGQKSGGRHAEEARARGCGHGNYGARHAERNARGARREGTFRSWAGSCVVE